MSARCWCWKRAPRSPCSKRCRPRQTRAMSALRSCWARNAQLDHVRLAPDASAAVQVEEVAMTAGRERAAIAPISPVSAPSCRAWNWRSRWKARAPRPHLSGVTVLGGKRHADVTTHVIHAVGHTQSTQLFKKVAGGRRQRRLSGQGDGGQGRRRLRQPPDRQGAAAGRRAPKPISSPNWKSSPMTSNAPMARRWAIWMRIRCSICAPAAFRKTRRGTCCSMPSWKMPWQSIAQ